MASDRRALLTAALGFTLLDLHPEPAPLTALKGWLNSWAGLGRVVTGMSRQGYQVSLGEHGPGVWIAVFFGGHGGHDVTRAAGTAQEASPWHAVQRAAWHALNQKADA